MFDPRLVAAILAGRTAGAVSRLLRRGGGATVPGDVALSIDPRALGKLGAALPGGSILVTGTNGKTTTTGLVVAALEAAGRRVVTNATGANLIYGLCAAAVADATATGRPRADIGVFEVDELWLERAVEEMRPRLVVVLNLLRDQLDRSAELETTAARIGRALRRMPAGSHVVANCDDPIVCSQVLGLDGLVPVGIDATEHLLPGLPHAADARACPRCGTALVFARVVVAHCGIYSCPACDFARPAPAHSALHVDATHIDHLRLTMADGAVLEAGIGGLYNAYNITAAYAALRTAGVDAGAAVRGIGRFRARFGRQETLELFGRRLRFLLAKNPSGYDEVLRTADELGRPGAYLLALNDRVADGRDVSWIWDVDVERLARSANAAPIVVSGTRAADLAVRLKYAGIAPDRIVVEPEPEQALRTVAAIGDQSAEAVVVPTYTAMLELRAVAERAGAVRAYWSTAP